MEGAHLFCVKSNEKRQTTFLCTVSKNASVRKIRSGRAFANVSLGLARIQWAIRNASFSKMGSQRAFRNVSFSKTRRYWAIGNASFSKTRSHRAFRNSSFCMERGDRCLRKRSFTSLHCNRSLGMRSRWERSRLLRLQNGGKEADNNPECIGICAQTKYIRPQLVSKQLWVRQFVNFTTSLVLQPFQYVLNASSRYSWHTQCAKGLESLHLSHQQYE